MSIRTDAPATANRWRARAARFQDAVHRGLMALLVAVNRAQVENLSGSGAAQPGSYPVPVRRGDLRRTADWGMLGALSGYVTAGGPFAPYAFQIHEGTGTSSRHGRRPFQDDAVKNTDALAYMGAAMDEALV